MANDMKRLTQFQKDTLQDICDIWRFAFILFVGLALATFAVLMAALALCNDAV